MGDVIALCNSSTGKSEDFYVISDNGSTVTALAKYNLYVGDIVQYDSNGENIESRTTLTNSEPGYGLQSSSAMLDIQNMRMTGVMAFSSTNYWVENDNLKSNYGNSYPAWVFDSNSNLWQPIQNYQTYSRNTLGKTSVTATLMSQEQAVSLGCDADEYTCENAPSWVKSTTYWLGSAGYRGNVWRVGFGGNVYDDDYGNDGNVGVRPVITIAKSDL